jgi:hypothetical protein
MKRKRSHLGLLQSTLARVNGDDKYMISRADVICLFFFECDKRSPLQASNLTYANVFPLPLPGIHTQSKAFAYCRGFGAVMIPKNGGTMRGDGSGPSANRGAQQMCRLRLGVMVKSDIKEGLRQMLGEGVNRPWLSLLSRDRLVPISRVRSRKGGHRLQTLSETGDRTTGRNRGSDRRRTEASCAARSGFPLVSDLGLNEPYTITSRIHPD